MDYYVLAYYHFVSLENPQEEVLRHKAFFQKGDYRGRIYLSEQGINGSLSAPVTDAQAYMDWMKEQASFRDIVFKVHTYDEHVFAKLTVKYRKQLVALDATPDMTKTGKHVSPQQWNEMLRDDDHLLLDVRNKYEWEVGRFEGAELPPCDTFREFNDYADKLKETTDPKTTKVMMYCTGGIRCELYSSLLKEKGFEQVFQLDGGIINYGQKEGSNHWLGKLFVFDDRLTVPISKEETPVIGRCRYCGTACESYYNCANVDCNDLFLCCLECLPSYEGCCTPKCTKAPRIRPYQHQGPHKPFRRWYHYANRREDLFKKQENYSENPENNIEAAQALAVQNGGVPCP